MPPHGFDISPDEKWVLEERRIREGPAYLLGSPQLFVLRFGFCKGGCWGLRFPRCDHHSPAALACSFHR